MFEHFFSRHADADKKKLAEGDESKKYVGITKEGEQKSLSQEKVLELAQIVENAPDGAVIFLGGISGAVRTRSTLEAYADGLKEHFKNSENVIFAPAGSEAIDFVKNSRNQNKKIVITQPLQMKHFSGDIDGFMEWKNYAIENQIPEEKEAEVWIGQKEGPGPDPVEMAEGILLDIERGEKFVEKLFPDKPFVSINVSHSFILDALAAYLSNGGRIDMEAYQKIGGKVIDNNELVKITHKPKKETILEYRGNQFNFEPENEEAEF